jgi:hypothetical protein
MSTGTKTSLIRYGIKVRNQFIVCIVYDQAQLRAVTSDRGHSLLDHREQVYNRKTEGDPIFNDFVDLTGKLKHGHNSFVILGVNWGGPAHYVGQLTLDGKVLLSMTFGLPSTPNGVVASWVAEITVS